MSPEEESGPVDEPVSVDGVPCFLGLRAASSARCWASMPRAASMKSCQMSAGKVLPVTALPPYSVSIGLSLSG